MNKILILTILFCLALSSAYSKNKPWICINENGETVFTIEAMSVYPFSNGLARVYRNTLVNNKWITGYGFINKKGEIVIRCDLDKANDFVGEVTWVKQEGNDFYSLMNKKGEIIPTAQYEKVGYFFENQKDICAVFKNNKMGFVNTKGEEVIPCQYTGSKSFSEGLACVSPYDSKEGKYGFINKKGETVIPMKFKQSGTTSFKNGYARASVNGKTVLIDSTGSVAFTTQRGNIQSMMHGLIGLFKGPNRTNWGWVNWNDEIVIELQYDHASSFNVDGYAVVEKNGLKGVIDTTGKVVIPFQYETVYADISEDGFFLGVLPSETPVSMVNAKKDYYNSRFEKLELQDITYIYSAENENLMRFSNSNDKEGYLNKKFEVIIPASFKKTKEFSEGLAWVLQ